MPKEIGEVAIRCFRILLNVQGQVALKAEYFGLYVARLKGCWMTKELKELNSGSIDPENMGCYINDYLLPKLKKMDKDDLPTPRQTSTLKYQGIDWSLSS